MLLIKNGEIYITICEEKRLPRRFAPRNDKSHLVCHRERSVAISNEDLRFEL